MRCCSIYLVAVCVCAFLLWMFVYFFSVFFETIACLGRVVRDHVKSAHGLAYVYILSMHTGLCVCVRLSFVVLSFILSAYLPYPLALSLSCSGSVSNYHMHTSFITYWFISFPNHVKIYFAVDDFNIVDDDDEDDNDGSSISTSVCV